MWDDYGLYVYIYNPRGLNLSTDSKSNKIQMAISYDSEGKPNDYAKFDLEFCSRSKDSNYKNLFCKFKVVDKKVKDTTFAERVNSNERRYDISGIELMTYGSSGATEYYVGGTNTFTTGYAKGYGPDATAESTLTSKVKYLETVELEVKHTFYRTTTSVKGRATRISWIRYISSFPSNSLILTAACKASKPSGMSTKPTILSSPAIRTFITALLCILESRSAPSTNTV